MCENFIDNFRKWHKYIVCGENFFVFKLYGYIGLVLHNEVLFPVRKENSILFIFLYNEHKFRGIYYGNRIKKQQNKSNDKNGNYDCIDLFGNIFY